MTHAPTNSFISTSIKEFKQSPANGVERNAEFHHQYADFHNTDKITPPLQPKMAEEQLCWSHVFNISYIEESSVSTKRNVRLNLLLNIPPNLTHAHRNLCWKMLPAVSSLKLGGGEGGGRGAVC